jgi:hypothetical protein
MRGIIQRHNRLNGLIFSIVEFVFIALFAGAFAAYYIAHRRWAMALIGSGIVFNCASVVFYGWRQLVDARSGGQAIGSYYSDKKAREQHRRENPHMFFDTLVFVTAALLPFVMLLAVLFDIPREKKV